MPPRITLIAAISEDHVLAVDDELPWSLPDDLRRFKRVTRGHAVIMGRRTLDTLPGPLVHRHNIVLTRSPDRVPAPAVAAGSLDEAIALGRRYAETQDLQDVYIAGGGRVYAEALPVADRLDLTRVHRRIAHADPAASGGDDRQDGSRRPALVIFPHFDCGEFRLVRARSVLPAEGASTRSHPNGSSHRANSDPFMFELWDREPQTGRV